MTNTAKKTEWVVEFMKVEGEGMGSKVKIAYRSPTRLAKGLAEQLRGNGWVAVAVTERPVKTYAESSLGALTLKPAPVVESKLTAESLGITQTSLDLFIAYCEDAPNWSGTPEISSNIGGDSRALRGNVTQLKKAGLIETFVDEDMPQCTWVQFTGKGKEVAAALGHPV